MNMTGSQMANARFQALQQQAALIQRRLQELNRSPQEMVQQLLNTGEITQAQFEQARQMANQLMGVNN